MFDVFQSLLQNQPFGMLIILGLMAGGVGLLATFAKEARKYACHRRDAELKRELVERGLAVDEIERIVRVRSSDRPDSKV